MTHKTKGIVLKSIKYGETSLVVTIFTELFGVQTYMVNGVRTSKQSAAKANHFQPTVILDLVVYHHEQKSIQRIKEFQFAHLYQHILSDVIKNSIALYQVELLYKCLKQPETNEALFAFCEDAFKMLDTASNTVAANFPLFFSLQLSYFFGFRPQQLSQEGTANEVNTGCWFDLKEGYFSNQPPAHAQYIEGELAILTSELLKVMHPVELESFALHHDTRRQLLQYYQEYYSLHVQDFGQMKTMKILSEVI